MLCIITGSPAVHGPVGDPLQIYADRFSGHYGLRNAKAKGRKLGRPRVAVPRDQIESLRQEGLSWEAIAKELGAGVGTVYRAYQVGCGA